jgi:hypothetical protein
MVSGSALLPSPADHFIVSPYQKHNDIESNTYVGDILQDRVCAWSFTCERCSRIPLTRLGASHRSTLSTALCLWRGSRLFSF